MAFIDFHWFSGVLRKQVGTYVIVPDGGTPPFAAFYLLHGLSDDHTVWQRRTRIEAYASKYPLIVVMPDGFRNFYTDNAEGPAYAKYVGEELPAVIERTFHAKTSGAAARCIGGLSMGGYGALRVGLKYAERYASINSHSGAPLVGEQEKGRIDDVEHRHIFGADPRGTEHDLTELARRAKEAGTLPRIRIDCGVDDFLIQDNRTYHRRLAEMGVPHEYEEYPGEHNWDYWDEHVREALAFHAKALGIAEKG